MADADEPSGPAKGPAAADGLDEDKATALEKRLRAFAATVRATAEPANRTPSLGQSLGQSVGGSDTADHERRARQEARGEATSREGTGTGAALDRRAFDQLTAEVAALRAELASLSASMGAITKRLAG